jgi:hypothetical protein
MENMAVSSEPTSDPLAYFDQLTATVEVTRAVTLDAQPGHHPGRRRARADRRAAAGPAGRAGRPGQTGPQRPLALTAQDPRDVTLPR